MALGEWKVRTLHHGPGGTQIKRCSPTTINIAVSSRGKSAAPAGLTYLLCLQSKRSLWTKALSSRTVRTFLFPRSWPVGPEVCSQDAPELPHQLALPSQIKTFGGSSGVPRRWGRDFDSLSEYSLFRKEGGIVFLIISW